MYILFKPDYGMQPVLRLLSPISSGGQRRQSNPIVNTMTSYLPD